MAEDLSSGHDPFLYDTIVDPSHELDNQPGEINTEESNHNEDPESLYAMEADGVNGYTGEAAAIPIQQAGDVQNDHLNASYRVEDHDHDGRGTHNAIVHFHSPLHGNYGERYSSSFYSDFVNESTQESKFNLLTPNSNKHSDYPSGVAASKSRAALVSCLPGTNSWRCDGL